MRYGYSHRKCASSTFLTMGTRHIREQPELVLELIEGFLSQLPAEPSAAH